MRVRFEHVSKRFGAHVAVRDIDLEVADRECLVLLGPSGCGKTTLLRLLAGLERVDEGRIWIGDREVQDLPPTDRDAAMVFQNYALYPHFTVFENIAFPLRARGVTRSEIAPRVKAAAARLGLDGLLDRRPAQLSGGQQQRVALARATVRNPAVYLMDEPLSNLDTQLRTRTRGELKQLQQELGTTMLYVTHDQSEAMTIGRRIGIMRQGSIVQIGSPLDLYHQPVNTFVATFLGSPAMNLLPAQLVDGQIRLAGLDAPMGLAPRAGAASLQIGVRPEDVAITSAPSPGAGEGRAEIVEPMGHETIVTLRCGDQRIIARVAADLHIEAGAPIWIRLPPERLLFFDAETGDRLTSP